MDLDKAKLQPRRSGFTLVELLVAVAIIATLAALLLPSLALVQTAGRRTQCASNQRQVYMGVIAYSDDWNGWVVPALQQYPEGRHHWHNVIAPYVTPGRVTNDAIGVHESGDLQLLDGKSVMKGCPDFMPVGAWALGYGINKRLGMPTNRMATTDLRSPPPDVPTMFKMDSVSNGSSRIVFGDNRSWNLDIGYNPIKNTVRWYSNEDPSRHRNHPNWTFFDGHVSSHSSTEAAWGVGDPSQAPF